MTLWATSDLHVGYKENRAAVETIVARPDDWLIVAGDTGETPAHLDFVLRTLVPRFAQVVWTPGNHDLWTPRDLASEQRGVAHYQRLVALCRRHGVLTPEDPYVKWPGDGPLRAIVPAFLLFDYSFRPADVPRDRAVAWAAESGIKAADEDFLSPAPFARCDDWCAARVAETEARLAVLPAGARIVFATHFPLLESMADTPRVPRFSLWCGTRLTDGWHTRYPMDVVVSGHLHMRSTRWRDGVRFEEVSLGYPPQWRRDRGATSYLRQILPEPAGRPAGWGLDATVLRHP